MEEKIRELKRWRETEDREKRRKNMVVKEIEEGQRSEIKEKDN